MRETQGSPGVVAIFRERERQIDEEGWTFEHDKQYMCGELEEAASCYLALASRQSKFILDPEVDTINEALIKNSLENTPDTWPFHESWWKPSKDPKRNLAKAGALIAAAYDRLGDAK
jgi:hypothetical protein